MRKSMIAYLQLVCPPISAFQSQLKINDYAKSIMKLSNLYMIASRAKYEIYTEQQEPSDKLYFQLKKDDIVIGSGNISLTEIALKYKFKLGAEYKIFAGRQAIEIIDTTNDKLIANYTPEILLWERSQNSSEISGLDNFKELSTYNLLYVGISAERNSYERLIGQAHEATQKILSLEYSISKNARVSDEVFLFFYKVEPFIFIGQLGSESTEEDWDNLYWHENIDNKTLVKDAEKAFIHLLTPKYNNELFKKFPKSEDGLYKHNLDGYVYMIGEDLIFNTPNMTIKGARVNELLTHLNDADFIYTNKDVSKIYIADQDFLENV